MISCNRLKSCLYICSCFDVGGAESAKARLGSSQPFLPREVGSRGEWPSGLYSLRQVAEVKLGRVRSDFGWVTTEA